MDQTKLLETFLNKALEKAEKVTLKGVVTRENGDEQEAEMEGHLLPGQDGNYMFVGKTRVVLSDDTLEE